jgi:ApaG protein
MSEAVTQGIRVTVRSAFLPERSSARTRQYVFAYTVTIANEGGEPAQLVTRHWIITDGNGNVQEVRGDGVVGQQPALAPGESFEYTSGCVLETPHGTMRGSYQMVRPDGRRFDAEISPFLLSQPTAVN